MDHALRIVDGQVVHSKRVGYQSEFELGRVPGSPEKPKGKPMTRLARGSSRPQAKFAVEAR